MAGRDGHRGFGHLRKLPSKRWQASYLGPDLARYNAPTTFAAREDAEAWLASERRLVSGEAGSRWTPPAQRAARRDTRLRFGEYAERWLQERNLKPRTADHYRTLLDRFLLPTFGDEALADITPEDVRTWHARLITGPTYRAHAYSLLRSIFRTAVEDQHAAASPCVIRGAGRAERSGQIKPATLGELEKLTAAMPERLRLMVLLAAWCALRFGELAELRRDDIDVVAGVVHVRRGVTWVDGQAIIGTPKSTAGIRDVAIPPHLLPLVKAHLREHTQWGRDGLLFPSPKGANLTSATLYESWWPARDAAGRPDLKFHHLRHTGAVLAAQTGATLAELMARLGHSTPAAAMRYQHAAKGRDAQIAALLSKLAETATP